MTTVVVTHRPQSPSGGAPRSMRAELIASLAAYTDDATTTVLGAEDFDPDSTGLVSLRLRPNSELAQNGTYYRVRIARSDITYYAVVPDVGPVQLVDILVDPTTLDPVGPVLPTLFQLRSEKAQVGGYASLDGTGKVPSAQLPATGGGVPSTRVLSGTAGRIIGGGDLSDDRSFDLHADVVAALVAAGTAVQPATLTAGLAEKLSLALFDAAGDLVIGSGDNAATRLAKGSDGQTLSVVGGALTWVTPFVPIVAYLRPTPGGFALPNTAGSWDPLTGFVLPGITASVGHLITMSYHGMRSNTGTAFLDLAVIVAGEPVWFASTGTATPPFEGDPGWYSTPADFLKISGARPLIVTSDHISAGKVTVAVVARAGGSGTLYADSNYPFNVMALNSGPVTVAA